MCASHLHNRQKWNSNFGTVAKRDDEAKRGDEAKQKLRDELPQAFSHWTHEETKGKMLVCDIQGTFSEKDNKFFLVDPVIHSQEKCQFGRTDHGLKGIYNFLESHECNSVCQRLGLEHNRHFRAVKNSGMAKTSSRNTSQITVSQTNHLRRRKTQRVVTTRECQAAVKHGKKTPAREGRVLHKNGDVTYVTDSTHKKGITTYRD